ncbi:MAG: hypothetical protein KF691_03865 [Phycisphaeraceae bacterium]|nr:hypothetical protein [Phycisphaeraceae bacterium]
MIRREILPSLVVLGIASLLVLVGFFLIARSNKRPGADEALRGPRSRLLHRADPNFDAGSEKNDLTLLYCTEANGRTEYFFINDQDDSRYFGHVELFNSLESAAFQIARNLRDRNVLAAEPAMAFEGPPAVRDWKDSELVRMHELLLDRK